MAVQIYYQSIHDIVINEQLLSTLQPKRREQLLSFRFEADKKRCATAGLLLWEHLYHHHPECFTVSYAATGKPSVSYRTDFSFDVPNSDILDSDAPDPSILTSSSSVSSSSVSSSSVSNSSICAPPIPFFNLSHSGDFVMLVISDTPVGCDIERLHKAILSHHVFHPKELAHLRLLPEGDTRNREFLRLWTAKEAFLKAIGTGIDANASSYDLSSDEPIHLADGSIWKIEHQSITDFPEYLSCVCYNLL